MAEEVEMIPVDAAEPPKSDPLAKPASVSSATVALSPATRNSAAGGAPSAGLRPGLRLPTQTALKPGLRLPTQTALKPGLRLPPKPGLKLPPKPVIHKPGEAVAAAPLPKPMEALKTVTQKLKGITQEIPQQAVLRKTGIIAEGNLSDAQKEAAKHKTARISLSDAMGVSPVKDEAAPMKTIRIKRPINIPSPTPSPNPQPKAAEVGPAPAEAAASPAEPTPAPEAPAPTITQRKTLKIARPGGVAVRPGGKFGIKRPGQATAAPTEGAAPAEDAEVADIPDISAAPAALAPVPAVSEGVSWVWTLSAIVQFAACVAIGALAWFLYENSQLPTYCGGLGWGS